MQNDGLLLRHLQDKRDEEHIHLIQVRTDMLWFCSAMQDLILQIQMWLQGSGVTFFSSAILHPDPSIRLWPNSQPTYYTVSKACLKKQDRMAMLLPIAVYGISGTRGHAELILTIPGDVPARKKFMFCLSRNSSQWIIREEHQWFSGGVQLNRATFLAAIAALA
jgi:hypothetical protein